MSVFVTAIGDPSSSPPIARAALLTTLREGKLLKVCAPCPNGKKFIGGNLSDCPFDLVVAEFYGTSASVDATEWATANKDRGLADLTIYITGP